MDKENHKEKRNINRRDFLKIVGAGTLSATALLYGCDNKNTAGSNTLQPSGTMTYRTNLHGEQVSLLG